MQSEQVGAREPKSADLSGVPEVFDPQIHNALASPNRE